MEKLSKKDKIYLSCLGILLIIGIISAFFSHTKEKYDAEQKQFVEEYVDSMIEAKNNIDDKINDIANGSTVIIGDYSYIAEQIESIQTCNVCLYSCQYNKVKYLDEYTKSQTNGISYQEYYDSLCRKYHLTQKKDDDIDYEEWYEQRARKLIHSAESKYERNN
jgi:uncharacterized protein (UPF0333 family)